MKTTVPNRQAHSEGEECGQLAEDIRRFVGKDGYIPFEHGFRPSTNMYAVDSEGILRLEGRRHVHEAFADMTREKLTAVIIDLFRYLNYCHLDA